MTANIRRRMKHGTCPSGTDILPMKAPRKCITIWDMGGWNRLQRMARKVTTQPYKFRWTSQSGKKWKNSKVPTDTLEMGLYEQRPAGKPCWQRWAPNSVRTPNYRNWKNEENEEISELEIKATEWGHRDRRIPCEKVKNAARPGGCSGTKATVLRTEKAELSQGAVWAKAGSQEERRKLGRYEAGQKDTIRSKSEIHKK